MAAAPNTSPSTPLPIDLPADPLAELRDIHLPGQIDSWPAPGWWLLGIVALLVTFLLLRYVWRIWQQRRYRADGITQLQQLRNDYQANPDSVVYLQGFSELLKRIALVNYPREQIAPLTGEAWVAFLDETGNTRDFTMGAGQVLIQGHYQPPGNIDVDALHSLGSRWIRRHQRTIKSLQRQKRQVERDNA